MSPKYSPDTHQVLTRSPKGKTKGTPETPETTTTTTQEAIFFGVFCFHKSKRQKPQKNRTKHGKKQTQKTKERTTEEGRGSQSAEGDSEDTECRPSASKEAHPMDEEQHKYSIECWCKAWEARPHHEEDRTKVEERGWRERANLDVGLDHTLRNLWR
jgi:hypothetical protein